jgi:hypothetical protein
LDLSLVGEGLSYLLVNGISVSLSEPVLVGLFLVSGKIWVNWGGLGSSWDWGCDWLRLKSLVALGVPQRILARSLISIVKWVGLAGLVGSSSSSCLLESPFSFPDVFLSFILCFISLKLDIIPLSGVQPCRSGSR